MTTPQAALLGFACWTLAVVVLPVGYYRWSRILTARAAIHEFRASGTTTDPGWYQRSLRAHANCVENLPVFGTIVAIASWTGATAPVLDVLSIVHLGARVGQTVTHVGFVETARTVGIRFSLFLVQVIGMVAMIVVIATYP